MTTSETTIDPVLDLAGRLTLADKLRVIERLAHDIVPVMQPLLRFQLILSKV